MIFLYICILIVCVYVLSRIINFSKKKNAEHVETIEVGEELTPRMLKYKAARDNAQNWLATFLHKDSEKLKDILEHRYLYYTYFSIKKKSGGFRSILAPKFQLLEIQQIINQRILNGVHLHPACVGFRKKKSVRDNAAPHLKNPYVLKVDLHNFFPSISKKRVMQVFLQIGYPYHVAEQLSTLCCIARKLPQGAATSPALSNIIAKNMDNDLMCLAQKHQLTYTRYADDLTFSGQSMDFDTVLKEIEEVVVKNDFKLNRSKTRRLSPNKRKIVTGISISNGEKLTLPRRKKRELRQAIYHVRTKGLENHLTKTNQTNDKRYIKRLLGNFNFWNQVEPNNPFVIASISYLKQYQK